MPASRWLAITMQAELSDDVLQRLVPFISTFSLVAVASSCCRLRPYAMAELNLRKKTCDCGCLSVIRHYDLRPLYSYPLPRSAWRCDGKPRQVFPNGGTVEIRCIRNREYGQSLRGCNRIIGPILRCPSVIYLWSWDHIETFRQSGSGWTRHSTGEWCCNRCVRSQWGSSSYIFVEAWLYICWLFHPSPGKCFRTAALRISGASWNVNMGTCHEHTRTGTGYLAPYCVALLSFICRAGNTLRHSASQGQDGSETAGGNGAATGVSGFSEAAAIIYLLRRGYIFANPSRQRPGHSRWLAIAIAPRSIDEPPLGEKQHNAVYFHNRASRLRGESILWVYGLRFWVLGVGFMVSGLGLRV